MKIYLDNCCFNRPFDDQSQLKIHLEAQAKLDVQRRILSGEYILVWSYILEYENDQNPFDVRKEAIIEWKSIAQEYIDESEEILCFAEQLQKKGIKPKDALHLACAVAANCDYFLTTDKKLLNTPIDGIITVNPIEFISRMEE